MARHSTLGSKPAKEQAGMLFLGEKQPGGS